MTYTLESAVKDGDALTFTITVTDDEGVQTVVVFGAWDSYVSTLSAEDASAYLMQEAQAAWTAKQPAVQDVTSQYSL